MRYGFISIPKAVNSNQTGGTIWEETKWLSGMKKKVTKKMAVSLLEKGRASVNRLYSQKTGRNFDADLVLDDTREYVNFKLDFSNNKKKG